MESIKEGKYVELVYDVFEVTPKQEAKMYTFTEEQPDRFVYGADRGMLEGFKKAIENKQAGDTFDVTLAPEDAFGPVLEEYIMDFKRELFEVDGKFDEERVKVGNTIEMMTADGHRIPGDVVALSSDYVKMDFNHPLAGQTIHFVGKVKTVRDATEAELHPQCGGCSSCGSCGGDEGCSSCGEEGGCGSCGCH